MMTSLCLSVCLSVRLFVASGAQANMCGYCTKLPNQSMREHVEDRPIVTRKPSYRWQTRATRKACQNCSNSTCLQHCRWQYWPIFMRLATVASEIREIPRNSLKIQTYGVQGHRRSSILVPIESPYATCY